MKTRLKLNWLIVVVIALTGLLPTARAFYAPATQRWLNRDPLGEEGFELPRKGSISVRAGEPNRYTFVANNPIRKVDPFGLTKIDYEKLMEQAAAAAEEAAKTAASEVVPCIGEVTAAFQVFKSCNTVGLMLAWANKQYENCLLDALNSGKDGAACDTKWNPKIDLINKVRKENCADAK